MLIVELDGNEMDVDDQLEKIGNALSSAGASDIVVAQSKTERERMWASRREMSYSLRKRAAYKLSEDVVVPISKMASLLDDCPKIAEKHGIRMPTYGHAGDGNLHVNYLWDDPSQQQSVDSAIEQTLRRVIEMGGTLSGEHGIGVLKSPYLPLEQSPQLIALQKNIKGVFDPNNILNPGKIFQEKRTHGPC